MFSWEPKWKDLCWNKSPIVEVRRACIDIFLIRFQISRFWEKTKDWNIENYRTTKTRKNFFISVKISIDPFFILHIQLICKLSQKMYLYLLICLGWTWDFGASSKIEFRILVIIWDWSLWVGVYITTYQRFFFLPCMSILCPAGVITCSHFGVRY